VTESSAPRFWFPVHCRQRLRGGCSSAELRGHGVAAEEGGVEPPRPEGSSRFERGAVTRSAGSSIVGLAGFEPTTPVPNAMRYQAALQPDCVPRARFERAQTWLRKPVLCPLSYRGMSTVGWSRTSCLLVIGEAPLPRGPRRHGGAYPERDSNPQPPRPERGASASWATRAWWSEWTDPGSNRAREACKATLHTSAPPRASGRTRTDYLRRTKATQVLTCFAGIGTLGRTRTGTIRPLKPLPPTVGLRGHAAGSCQSAGGGRVAARPPAVLSARRGRPTTEPAGSPAAASAPRPASCRPCAGYTVRTRRPCSSRCSGRRGSGARCDRPWWRGRHSRRSGPRHERRHPCATRPARPCTVTW
jgi:hypothetical protein